MHTPSHSCIKKLTLTLTLTEWHCSPAPATAYKYADIHISCLCKQQKFSPQWATLPQISRVAPEELPKGEWPLSSSICTCCQVLSVVCGEVCSGGLCCQAAMQGTLRVAGMKPCNCMPASGVHCMPGADIHGKKGACPLHCQTRAELLLLRLRPLRCMGRQVLIRDWVCFLAKARPQRGHPLVAGDECPGQFCTRPAGTPATYNGGSLVRWLPPLLAQFGAQTVPVHQQPARSRACLQQACPYSRAMLLIAGQLLQACRLIHHLV